MGNIPLHPMIVHFPIVLSVLLPIVALGAIIAARRSLQPARIWLLPMSIAVVLAGSALLATRTGQAEEERVERVVPENALHEHEEAAERFLVLAAVLAVVAGAGLIRGVTGSAARLVTAAGSLVVLFAGFQVGKAGGEIVYAHNAGAAYAQAAAPEGAEAPNDEDDDDD